MFGRLINPFLARVYRLDIEAMRGVDPDLSDVPTSGYDDDFREPVLDDTCGAGVGKPSRRELDPVDFETQIIGKSSSEALRMMAGGNAPDVGIELGASARDLDSRGLLGDDGLPVFRPGDRLDSIWTLQGGLVWQIMNPPGLFFVGVTPTGWGGPLAAPRRNLFRIMWQDRQVSARRRT